MTFSTRNSYYLRISRDTVLVLYLYLDQAHVRWMTDFTLQKVLNDLRTRIGPKLEAEKDMTANVGSTAGQSGKKGGPTIDVHQGDDYQFCYFLRKTEHRHVVLVKNKRFVSRPIPPAPDFDGAFDDAEDATPAPRTRRSRSKSTRGKGKGRDGSTAAGKKRRRVVDSEEGDGEMERSMRSETRESEDGSERDESVGPSRLRGGAGNEEEDEESPMRALRRESTAMEHHEDVDAASSPTATPAPSFPTVKADPDDPLQPSLSDLLVGPANEDDDDDEAPLVAMTEEDFPPAALGAEEMEDQKPFDLGAGGNLGGPSGGGFDEDEKLFKPALELTYLGFSIYEKHLCIVIEPWPALPSAPKNRNNSRTPSSTPFGSHFSDRPPAQSRSGSVASSSATFTPVPSSRRGASNSVTPGPSSSSSLRTGTPLFRPQTPMDDDEDGREEEWEAWRGRSVSVVPGGGRTMSPSVEPEDRGGDEGKGGMMQFSQVMMTSGGRGDGEVRVGEGEEGEDGGDGGDDGEGGDI